MPRKTRAKKDAAKAQAFKETLAQNLSEVARGARKVRVWVADEHRYGLLPVIRNHGTSPGNGLCAIPRNNMTTAMTSVQELLHLPQGRKRTALRIEMLQSINLGETAPLRVLRGYLEASLWASMDEDGNPLDRDFTISNLSTEAILSAWAECSRFIRECETDLPHLDDEHAGRNFWLTRNSHGLGFFDEKVDDESAEIAMQQLTRASEAFGEVDLYLGDDRKLHFTNERSIA